MEEVLFQVQDMVLSRLMRGYASLLFQRSLAVFWMRLLLCFGTIKKGIMKLLDERFGAFRVNIAIGQIGVHTLSFQEVKACGAP